MFSPAVRFVVESIRLDVLPKQNPTFSLRGFEGLEKPSKSVLTVFFQIGMFFFSCAPLLFLSFSEVEVLSDRALLSLLSFACIFLLL